MARSHSVLSFCMYVCVCVRGYFWTVPALGGSLYSLPRPPLFGRIPDALITLSYLRLRGKCDGGGGGGNERALRTGINFLKEGFSDKIWSKMKKKGPLFSKGASIQKGWCEATFVLRRHWLHSYRGAGIDFLLSLTGVLANCVTAGRWGQNVNLTVGTLGKRRVSELSEREGGVGGGAECHRLQN